METVRMKAILVFVAATLMWSSVTCAQEGESTVTKETKVPAALNFKMKSIDGEEVDLAQYQGKVVLVVNVASRCGMTPQYRDLQAMYEKYSDQGLVILGFPCNQFGKQEPGSESEIKEFCSTNYNVSFPLFAKIEVNGDGRSDLYRYLTGLDLQPKGKGDIGWNFEKFLIDRSGTVIGRFSSRANPSSPEIETMIVEALKAK